MREVVAISAASFEAWVSAAVLAPSSHNTQPWLFRLRDGAIELIADRLRALPVNDPHDRELTISCGAALFNLRVAAAAAGWQPVVQLAPVPGDDDLLARLHTVGIDGVVPEAALAPAMTSRHTCRDRFADQPLEPATLAALAEAALAEGAQLRVLADASLREQVAALVAEGDARQWANPSWRRELAAWMHPRRRGDGLALPGLAVPLAQAVVRRIDMGAGMGAHDRELAASSPALTVLGTAGDTLHDWLAAGQALQHMLLVAAARGLQASYLNPPVQEAELRPRVQALAPDAGQPQLLMRWGRPTQPPTPAPRRALAEVIVP